VPAGRRAAQLGLAAWSAVVALGVLWPQIWPLDRRTGIRAAPFFAHWDWHATARLGWACAAGVLLVVMLPRLVDAVSLRRLPVLTGVLAAGWAALVAVAGGGWDRLSSPLHSVYVEYLPFAARIAPGEFLRTYVERVADYPTHVKSHPPGMVLVLWALDRIGLGGVRWESALVLAGWGLATASVVWTIGRLAAPSAARRAAPFVVVAPAVLFAASTADAVFAGVAAAAIAISVAAITSRPSGRADGLALAAGLTWGAALFLSYGLAPLLAAPIAVALTRRRVRPLLIAGAATLAVVVAFGLAGFWWWDGLRVTRHHYEIGLSRLRPYGYFVFAGNLAALALCIGPAAGAGIGRVVARARRRPPAALALGAGLLAALVTADLSGMSKAEVERIWLPFAVWAAAAGGWAGAGPRAHRAWIALHVVGTLALEAWLVTPW